jgi:hypothetical protein
VETSAMSDPEFLASFEAMGIPASGFRHRDHVRLAWIYLQDADLAQGSSRFCVNFRRFVRHFGVESKFHETITWFYLAKVFERIRTHDPRLRWEEFARVNGDLLDGSMGIVRSRYRAETLRGPLARSVFLLPDFPGEPFEPEARLEASQAPIAT